jgi:Fe-S-cluster containining protein
VFGHDLYRLVRKRNLDPRSFTFICEQEQPDKVGFRLRSDGPTYGIALDKKEKLEVNQPCTFLVEEENGSSHCGIYEDRPIACATYPMSRALNGIAMLPATLCPPDAWAANETDNPQWARGLRRLARYRDTYVEVVNRWNAWIASVPNTSRPPEHFVAYVLQVYERLAALDAEIGDDALSAVEQSWASLPADAPANARQQDEPSWITYFRRARNVIDEFFPDLPPVPFSRITLER